MFFWMFFLILYEKEKKKKGKKGEVMELLRPMRTIIPIRVVEICPCILVLQDSQLSEVEVGWKVTLEAVSLMVVLWLDGILSLFTFQYNSSLLILWFCSSTQVRFITQYAVT